MYFVLLFAFAGTVLGGPSKPFTGKTIALNTVSSGKLNSIHSLYVHKQRCQVDEAIRQTSNYSLRPAITLMVRSGQVEQVPHPGWSFHLAAVRDICYFSTRPDDDDDVIAQLKSQSRSCRSMTGELCDHCRHVLTVQLVKRYT